MMNPADLSTPLTDAEYHQLNAFLFALGRDDAMLDVSEFDGFITAVVSGPDMIPPSEWLPVVWGGEDNAPVWDSMEEYQRIFGLMIRHMNSTADTLMQRPTQYEPCFLQREVRGVNHWVVDEWCAGYLKGVGLRPAWLEAGPEMEALLAPIRRFADADGWPEREGQTDGEIRRLQEQIEPAVRAMHAWWLTRRTPVAASPATYIRPEPKVGRNDPCPCGSGRKYKRCCGAH